MSTYAGIIGLQAFFVATGLFASAISRNQVVAAVLGFGINFVVFFVGLYHSLFRGDESIIPRGETVLMTGDRLVFLTRPENRDALLKALTGGPV